MKVRISKTFDFDAAHRLPNVPAGHKCGHLHGHTYRVDVMLEGEPTAADGWFIDYADIAAAWERVHREVDHRYLNDIPGLENPTTEVLAPWIMKMLDMDARVAPFLVAVRVHESSSTWCEVQR